MFQPVVGRWLCCFHINKGFLKYCTLWYMHCPCSSISWWKFYSCYPLVFHKKFVFYCKYRCPYFTLFMLQIEELIFLSLLLTNVWIIKLHPYNWWHRWFAVFMLYLLYRSVVTFSGPSSIDIFAMMSNFFFPVTSNTCGKPPIVSKYLQCSTISSNCCIFDETSDDGTFMAAIVTVHSLAFSSIYLL